MPKITKKSKTNTQSFSVRFQQTSNTLADLFAPLQLRFHEEEIANIAREQSRFSEPAVPLH